MFSVKGASTTDTRRRYLVPLTIGPAFLSAAIYLSLARLVVIHGPHLSRFAPQTYTRLFITSDIISLILQAAGGALAASGDDLDMKQTGVNVMIAGLVFQVASLAVFMGLCGDFWWSVRRSAGGYGGVAVDEFSRLKGRGMFKAFPWGRSLSVVDVVGWITNGCSARTGDPDDLYPLRVPRGRAAGRLRGGTGE